MISKPKRKRPSGGDGPGKTVLYGKRNQLYLTNINFIKKLSLMMTILYL